MAVKQTLTFNELWESVETNHDWISEMAYRYALNIKYMKCMSNYAHPLDKFLAEVVYY